MKVGIIQEPGVFPMMSKSAIWLKKSKMISIERSDGFSSMKKILKQAKLKMQKGHSIIIFPEGILKQTSLYARIISTIVMLLIYYLAKKNILVSVLCSTLFFTLINYYQEFI